MLAPGLIAGGVALAALALHLRDPHDQGSWGICPSAAMGVYCPGCGGLRAVNDLGNGRLFDAASSNLLFIATLPLVLYVFGRWTAGRWTGRDWRASDRAIGRWGAALITAMIAFTIARNTGAGAWLAP